MMNVAFDASQFQAAASDRIVRPSDGSRVISARVSFGVIP